MSGSEHQPATKSVKMILTSLFIICAVVFVIDFLFLSERFDKHAIYDWENWPGFYAVFGFVSCVLLVLISKYILRPLIKKDEDFYE